MVTYAPFKDVANVMNFDNVLGISGTTMYMLDDNGKLFFVHTEEDGEIKSWTMRLGGN